MAKTLVKEISADIEDAVKAALHRLTSEARNVSHIADDLAEDAATRGRRITRLARREIKDHPLRAIAIGAALGAVATLLLTRRG